MEHAELTLTREEALVVIGLGATSSDGRVDEVELASLVGDLDRLGVLVAISEDEREDFVLRVVGLCEQHGLRGLLGVAMTRLHEPPCEAGDRETAIALAIEVLLVDGVLPDPEFAYLRDLKWGLNVSDDRFAALTSRPPGAS